MLEPDHPRASGHGRLRRQGLSFHGGAGGRQAPCRAHRHGGLHRLLGGRHSPRHRRYGWQDQRLGYNLGLAGGDAGGARGGYRVAAMAPQGRRGACGGGGFHMLDVARHKGQLHASLHGARGDRDRRRVHPRRQARGDGERRRRAPHLGPSLWGVRVHSVRARFPQGRPHLPRLPRGLAGGGDGRHGRGGVPHQPSDRQAHWSAPRERDLQPAGALGLGGGGGVLPWPPNRGHCQPGHARIPMGHPEYAATGEVDAR
mmetsp:Transcript_21107/g.66847  ORF Transcript_21107/g.66847 Transcript_21107/m.66847 type:complete len:257 (+) Transcript_21107:293-1063(+)